MRNEVDPVANPTANPKRELPTPVLKYLCELEQEAKKCVGVVPETILEDAREYLLQDFAALQSAEPDTSEDLIYEHFVAQFGRPQEVAEAYMPAESSSPRKLGNAPGWRVCCTSCGRSAPAANAGITRIGARSWHKYIAGWCQGCRRLRFFRLIRDLDSNNLTAAMSGDATGDEVRKRMHHPLLVIASILLLVLTINVTVHWGVHRAFGQNAQFADITFEKLPSGWNLQKLTVVPASQLPAISSKLGGEIEYLSNAVVSDGETSVQINVIKPESTRESEKIYKSLRNLKDARSIVQRGDDIVEFVARDKAQLLLANRARYELKIQPPVQHYHVEFDAMPITDGDYIHWNDLFNAWLQYGVQPSATAEAQVRSLANAFNLRKESRCEIMVWDLGRPGGN